MPAIAKTRYKLDSQWPTDGVNFPPWTFYVSHVGDDGNDGSFVSPWREPQFAANWIYDNVDISRCQPEIQILPGTYNQGVEVAGALTGLQVKGGGPLIIRGIPRYRPDGTPYPGQAGLSVNANDYYFSTPGVNTFSADLDAHLLLYGLAIDCPNAVGAYATGGAKIELGLCRFRRAAFHMGAEGPGSSFIVTGDTNADDAALAHWLVSTGGFGRVVTGVTTQFNNPSFTLGALYGVLDGVFAAGGAKYLGAFTGRRFWLQKRCKVATDTVTCPFPGPAGMAGDNVGVNDGTNYTDWPNPHPNT